MENKDINPESLCFDSWTDLGICPDCGRPTANGLSIEGCKIPPIECETCGAQSCDVSC